MLNAVTDRCSEWIGHIRSDMPALFIDTIPTSQSLNMLNVGYLRNRKAGRLQASHTELNAINRHDFQCLAFDVGQKSCQGKYSIWDSGLELCIPSEDDNRANGVSRQELKELLNCAHMLVVLAYGVLKSELLAIQHLCPIAVIWAGKYPTSVVFGLYNKYTEARDQNVIDLSCSFPQAKRYMVQEVVVR